LGGRGFAKASLYNAAMRLKHLAVWFFATFLVAASAAPTRACIDYASKIPSLSPSMCDAAGLRDMQGRSAKGRTLWGTDVKPNDPNFRVLVIGGIHGDEMTSSALVFHWITLAQTPPSDMALSIHWRFVPSLNPDGLFSRPSRRTNANGVDLNRNFPTPNWARDAKEYWEIRTRRDPRRWPGPKPLSEPESRFLLEQMDTFKPNLIVSVHAPYGVLDFDGPSVPPSKLGRLYLDQVGIFPGSLGNYGGVHKRVPVVTIELPNASRMIQDTEIRQMWIDLLRWTTERLGPAQLAKSP
jgi:murein peptide amidase A